MSMYIYKNFSFRVYLSSDVNNSVRPLVVYQHYHMRPLPVMSALAHFVVNVRL